MYNSHWPHSLLLALRVAPSFSPIRKYIRHGLTNDGIPQVNIDQLNPKTLFSGFSLPDAPVARQCKNVTYDGEVYNFTATH